MVTVASAGTGAKILLFDIENAPSNAYIWSLWKDVNSTAFINDDWYVMSWSAKWLGATETVTMALPDYPGFKKDQKDDKALLEDLWVLLDEADIVIGHNGKKFDRRKVNARFVMNGIKPPSPYKVVDTLLEARRNFMFTSNRLDDLGVYLDVGRKVATGGFELWTSCMAGDLDAWARMKKYNEMDVILLEKVYFALLPYMTSHPNVGVYTDSDTPVCAKCGSENLETSDKYAFTAVSQFPILLCSDCGAWSRKRTNVLVKSKRKGMLTAIAGQ